MDEAVAEWVSRRTLDEAMAVFEAEEIAAAPVYDVAQLVADEQMQARKVFVRVDDDELGDLLVQAPVPRFSGEEGVVDTLGPPIGQHTSEVLSEILDLTDAEISHLRDRNIVR